jgi:hypothetical protein
MSSPESKKKKKTTKGKAEKQIAQSQQTEFFVRVFNILGSFMFSKQDQYQIG